MAHLEVQRKKGSPWWLWLLLAIIIVGLLWYFLGYRKNTTESTAVADTTQNSTVAPVDNTAVASTTINYDAVDFNAPRTSYDEMTDTTIGVSGNNNYTIYSLGENVLFATDQAGLQGNAAPKLKQVAASITKRFNGASVGVYGHADSTGSAGHNKKLGAERANAVKDWLIKNGDISADKISVHSLGETQPVASNNTDAGRKENRYVKIVVFPQGNNNQ